MKVHLILVVDILLVLIFLRQDTVGMGRGQGIIVSPKLLLYHANVTWEEAFTTCRKTSAVLSMPVSRDEINAVQKTLGSREHVWIGQYTYDTPWMYPTGCYISNSSHYTRIDNYDVPTCKRICGDSDIMINMYKCLCVERAPDIATRANLISECDATCAANNCGGNLYLHYATYTQTKQESSGNDCGMYERSNYPAYVRILARNCEARNPSLCMSYDDVTNRTWLYPLKDDTGTVLYLSYGEAEDTCTRNGSVLADPTKLHEIVWKPEDPIRYWIGARRRTVYVNSTEVLPTNNTNPECLFISRLSTRVSRNRRKDCHSPSSYLCRKEDSNMTSPTDGEIDPSITNTRTLITAIVSTVIAVLTVLVLVVVVRSNRFKLGRMCCVHTSNTDTIPLQLMNHADC